MARYSKKSVSGEQFSEEALTIARGIQKPGQTKEQTRLIAQGIQKGIALYKKQQAAKKRELDKSIKKAVLVSNNEPPNNVEVERQACSASKLSWFLLLLSWICFAIYFFLI